MLDQREATEAVAHSEPSAIGSPSPRPELLIREDSGPDAERRAQGLKNCASGALLISIGFAFGGSVFLGNPGPLDWVFDSLGTLWLGKGLWEIWSA